MCEEALRSLFQHLVPLWSSFENQNLWLGMSINTYNVRFWAISYYFLLSVLQDLWVNCGSVKHVLLWCSQLCEAFGNIASMLTIKQISPLVFMISLLLDAIQMPKKKHPKSPARLWTFQVSILGTMRNAPGDSPQSAVHVPVASFGTVPHRSPRWRSRHPSSRWPDFARKWPPNAGPRVRRGPRKCPTWRLGKGP